MIRIAAVDDEEACALHMKKLVEQYEREQNEKVELRWFGDGLEFLDKYAGEYDVVFMDIEMPYMNGIDVARKLREKDARVALIFVTVMEQYAIAGYEVDAMDFIVKPITYLNFCIKLEKAVKWRRGGERSFMKFLDEKGYENFVAPQDVRYIESFNHYVIFHTEAGDFQRLGKISAIEEQFAEYGFLRCNNSTVVNPAYVDKIGKDSIVIHGMEITITRSRKKEFMQNFTSYYKFIY